MASRYGGITGSKRISEDFQNINTAFENVQTEMDANKAVVDNHLSSTTAHKAEDITYSGEVPGSNVKQAIDGLDTRIDNIVAQSGDDITEIVDARGGYPVLGARLDHIDDQITSKLDGVSTGNNIIPLIIHSDKGVKINSIDGTKTNPNVDDKNPVVWVQKFVLP